MMGKIKSRWMQEAEPFEDEGFNDLIREIRKFSREFMEDNDRAEEKEYARRSQRVSLWEV
jgi:hypothetical protein